MAAADPSFVYVANADSQDISVFELAPDGALHARATVAAQTPAQPGRSMLLAASPYAQLGARLGARFLYAGFLSGAMHSAAAAFAVDAATGIPTLLGTSPLADSMAFMSTDGTGRYLLCASYSGNKITVNSIASDGIVGAALQIVETEPNAHCILTDPSNRYALHTSLGGDLVYQQRFDAQTGMLSPNDPPSVSVDAKAGPRILRFSPGGRFVYVICELDGSIRVFPFDGATGTLKRQVQVVSALPAGFSGRAWAADISLTPIGAFLYVSERSSSTLSAYGVEGASGLLALIGSYPTVKQPRAIAIDPTGRFLLVAGQLSNSIMGYAIDQASGRLRALSEYAVGRNPTWIEILQFAGRGFAAASTIASPMRP